MRSEEILKGNELIAQFMGMHKSKYSQWCFKEEYICIEGEDYADYWHRELFFHSKWDWLMLVVEKIESLTPLSKRSFDGRIIYPEKHIVQIDGKSCRVNVDGEQISMMHTFGGRKIDMTYETVIKFITYYTLKDS